MTLYEVYYPFLHYSFHYSMTNKSDYFRNTISDFHVETLLKKDKYNGITEKPRNGYRKLIPIGSLLLSSLD